MNQELRQAAAQAKEALLGVVRVFPTDTDMAEANWPTADINSACDAYDAARAALSALSAVLEKQDSSHLAAPTDEARSGSGVPARPTIPGEVALAKALRLGLEHAKWNRDRSKDPWERQLNEHDVRTIEAALSASPLPQEGRWMPIESAPKDGTHVQLYRPMIQFTGYFATKAECWCANASGLPIIEPPPTHWMPLPAAPGTQGEQKP